MLNIIAKAPGDSSSPAPNSHPHGQREVNAPLPWWQRLESRPAAAIGTDAARREREREQHGESPSLLCNSPFA